jgi:hypothetical protein
MRSVLVASLALIALSASAQPQQQGAPQQPPQQQAGAPKPQKPLDPKEAARLFVQRLTEDLDLSKEQSDKIFAIAQPAAEQEAELVKKLREHQRTTHEKIRGVLNDEQKEKFDALRFRRPEGAAPQAGAPGAPAAPMGQAPKTPPAKKPAPKK